MNLYFVRADDRNGERLDLFVRALTPVLAATFMLAHYDIELEDIDEDGIRVITLPETGPIGAINWQDLLDSAVKL